MNHQPQMDEARAAVKQQLLKTLMQQAVDELAADSQEKIDQQIREIDIDLVPARDRIRRIIESRESSVREETEQRVREMIRSESMAAWEGLDMDAVMTESLSNAAPDISLNEELRLQILGTVNAIVQAQVKAVIDETTARAMNDVDVSSAVRDAVTSRVRDLSSGMMETNNDIWSGIAEETAASVITESNIMDEISSDVRMLLVQRIAERTLDGLGDADRLSQEARSLITFDHDDLIAATTILRTRIIQDIARRTARSLGNRDELASDAEMWISASDPEMESAHNAAKACLTRHLTDELKKELRSSSAIVSTAADDVLNENDKDVADTVSATRELIIAKISELTAEKLNDTEFLAARAASAIPAEVASVQRVVKATMALIIGEVIAEAEGRLMHVEKLSSEARTRMAESLPGVEQAADMLEGMLVAEVEKLAHQRLADVDRIAAAAQSGLQVASELDAARDALLSTLYEQIACRAQAELSKTDVVMNEAFGRIDQNSDEMVNLVRSVTDKALHAVSARTLGALGEMERALPEAMAHVPEHAPELELLACTLRDRIMATVLADTLRSLGESVQKGTTSDDMNVLRQAMTLVLESGKESVAWTALSEMDEAVPVAEADEITAEEHTAEEHSKHWSVSELLAGGDGAPRPTSMDATLPSAEHQVDNSHSVLFVYGVMDMDALNPDSLENVEGLVGGSRLQFHVCEDLCAVTSRVPASVYAGQALREAMTEAAWTKEQVAKHASILNALPSVDALVPLPFGEVFDSPVDLDDFLSERHDAFRDALSRLSNRKEFSVRLQVDMHVMREHYMSSDARIDASLNDMTHGVAGFIRDELKLSAETPEESQLAMLIQNIVSNTHTRILGVASEGLLKNVPASPDATHRIVLNASYLVSAAKEAEFRATVNAIASQYMQMGVEIQLSGPWMAYHFTHIEPFNEFAM